MRRSLLIFFSRMLTRGDLDVYVVAAFVVIFLMTGDVRRGVNAICVRGVNVDESTVAGVWIGNLSWLEKMRCCCCVCRFLFNVIGVIVGDWCCRCTGDEGCLCGILVLIRWCCCRTYVAERAGDDMGRRVFVGPSSETIFKWGERCLFRISTGGVRSLSPSGLCDAK